VRVNGTRAVKYRFGDVTLDEDARQVLRADREVHLSRKAFDLLAALLRERPRALSKTHLHALLWPDTFVSDANLAMLVAEVRRAIGDDVRRPRFVRTLQRYGYAFHGDATEWPRVRPCGTDGTTSKFWLIASLRQIPLATGDNVVGRDPHAQVWLDSAGVSRQHARITVDGDCVTLEDLESKNGTRVHGQPITAAVRLADGDLIRFGSIEVSFRVWTGGEETKTDRDQ
jgi:DNA-binding winged helix-turn-helix (wHTH) protein